MIFHCSGRYPRRAFVYDNWEYHPIYGVYTRIVYKKVGDDSLVMVGREYKALKV